MNPFSGKDNSNPFAYSVETTYVPPTADDVVPSVPDHAVPAVPAPSTLQPASVAVAVEPVQAALPFTESTTSSSYVSGKLSSDPRPFQASAEPTESARLFQGPTSTAPPAAPPAAAANQNYAFYNVRRYRKWFDVDTKEVAWRVGNSIIGPFHANFMKRTWEQPDLYGPFWVATTLIFVTAVAGNYANYIEWRRNESSTPPSPPDSGSGAFDRQWYTDYGKMGWSALLYYGYVFILGLVLYFVVRYFKADMQLVNVWCIYGYSLTIFIPISFACIPPIQWLRWTVIMVATGISAFFLFMNFRATIWAAAPARASVMLLVIVGLHVGLGIVLKLFFFDY